jgi:hypothetical protein
MAITKGQKDNASGTMPDGAKSYSSSGVEIAERAPIPGYDQFSVTPEERKTFGIQDNETVAWIRNPEHWEKHEGSDRIREFINTRDEQGRKTREGARVVTDPSGSMITNMDLVLMAYPKVHQEREETQRLAEYEEYVNGDIGDRYPKQPDRLRQIAQDMSRGHERSGMTGRNSATSGLDLTSAYSKYSDAQIEEEENRYRRGSRVQEFSDAEWGKMIDRQQSQPRARSAKTYAVGDTGFGRNPNSAVAQAAKRKNN